MDSLQTYYFKTRSGYQTKIQTSSKEAAKHAYRGMILPSVYLPSYKKFCSNRICSSSHNLNASANPVSFELDRFIDIYHTLLTKYPNCDILRRFALMFYEKPKIAYSDYKTVIETASGMKIYKQPATMTFHWTKANIKYETAAREGAWANDRWALEQIIKQMGCDTNYNTCFHLICINAIKLSKFQQDALAGSLEPSLEPYNEEISPKKSPFVLLLNLFKRKTYETIHIKEGKN